MSKQATQAFELHKLMMHNTEDVMRSAGGKSMKRVSRQQMVKDVVHSEPLFLESLDMIILSEELFWAKKSKRVILPENSEIFERLLKAQYTMDSAKGFNLPYASFVLAMPEGFTHEGVRIPSCMVDYAPYETSGARIIHPFYDYVGIKHPVVNIEDCTPGAYYLSITYREVESMAYARVMMTDDDLPAILGSTSAEQFRDRLGEYDHFRGLTSLNSTDYHIQYWLLRLVSAIGIYHLATSGQHLHDGFPGKKMPTLIDRDPSQMIQMSYLSTAKVSEIKPALNPLAKKPGVVDTPWHFNQNSLPQYDEDDADDHPFGLYFASGGQ